MWSCWKVNGYYDQNISVAVTVKHISHLAHNCFWDSWNWLQTFLIQLSNQYLKWILVKQALIMFCQETVCKVVSCSDLLLSALSLQWPFSCFLACYLWLYGALLQLLEIRKEHIAFEENIKYLVGIHCMLWIVEWILMFLQVLKPHCSSCWTIRKSSTLEVLVKFWPKASSPAFWPKASSLSQSLHFRNNHTYDMICTGVQTLTYDRSDSLRCFPEKFINFGATAEKARPGQHMAAKTAKTCEKLRETLKKKLCENLAKTLRKA